MSSKVTVVIPTHDRPEMCGRALLSAQTQTVRPRVIIVDSWEETTHGDYRDIGNGGNGDAFGYFHIPDNDSGPSVLSWYVGAQMASTPYVAILFDDDWYEPTFIERMVSLLDGGAHFAFSEAMIRGATDRPNFCIDVPRGMLDTDNLMSALRRMPYTISPGCCVFRRETILRHLMVNEIPGVGRGLVGPDKLLLMRATDEAELVGWDPEPLVNFSAHDGSTTIKALHDDPKGLEAKYRLTQCYFEATR